jgi:pimeloyl-ACP methyl ester carboxylesterase
VPRARVNGVELEYAVHGAGPPLVLVHEFAGCLKSWDPQRPLARAHRLVVYNCRGYPPSSVPGDLADYSQDISVEDLRALLDELAIARTALGGFSMGGSIALTFALRHPERVSALVLAGTGTGSADRTAFVREFGAIADRFEREGARAVAEEYLRGPTRIQLLRKDPAMWQKFHADFVELSGLGLAQTLRGVQLRRPTMYELREGLRTLRVPTLVIVGEEDTPAVEASRFLAATIPGAILTVLPGTGHTVNLEEPRAFNAAVEDFLRDVETTSSS